MPVTADKPGPYATSGAILDLVGRYRSRGLPSPVDSDVLGRAGIAQTLIPRTLQTLHTLDLIDPKTGMPTQTFEALRLASEDEFKDRLSAWIRGLMPTYSRSLIPQKMGKPGSGTLFAPINQ